MRIGFKGLIKNKNMRKLLFIILILNPYLNFSQSKKEQIEILKGNIDSLKIALQNEEKSIDSIKTVLLNERNANFKKAQELNTVIENLENQVYSLKSEFKDVTTNLNQLKLENNKIITQLQDSINIYRNKLTTTSQFYEKFLIDQGLISQNDGVAQPVTTDGIFDIGNLIIYTRSELLNPEEEMGHEFVYKTTSYFYQLRGNDYQQVKLEECFNSKKNEILEVITNKIKEILKNPDELDPCGLVAQKVKFPIVFANLLFFVDGDQYCFQFVESNLCGGETQISFSKEEILKYLK
jgi:hypothetical protein